MDLVKDAAKRFGKHPALITPERSWSFIECERESARISSTLASLGIVSGDIVSIVAPNSPELLLLLMALLRLGAVAAPVNHRFPAIHIDGVIERLAPKLTLFDPEVCPSLTVERAITFETFETLLQASLSSKFTAAQKPDRPASIIHTSASTGMPKAAMHSVSNHWHNAVGSAINLPFGPGECWLLSLPLYHIGGYSMLFKCLTGGGALAAAPQGINLETSLESLPVTHLSLVPTQLYRLLRTPKGAKLLGRLKAILLGGSAASRTLLEEAVKAGLPVYLTYGSTEMGSQVSTSTRPIDSATIESGAILPYREVAISDEGEILVKGPCLFMGYLNTVSGRHELNSSRDGLGWFHTGDIGSLTDDSSLAVLGRRDNMFISGGENIHPEEIEKAIASLPGVEEALVVPVPDNEYGMRPMAWIRMSEKKGVNDAVIASMAAAALGGLKTPVAFRRVEEWVTIAGSAKIDRGWYRRQVTSDE